MLEGIKVLEVLEGVNLEHLEHFEHLEHLVSHQAWGAQAFSPGVYGTQGSNRPGDST